MTITEKIQNNIPLTDEEMLQRIKLYITGNYRPSDGALNCDWENGNANDSFENGCLCAKACELYTIGKMLGMDLEELELGEDDE